MNRKRKIHKLARSSSSPSPSAPSYKNLTRPQESIFVDNRQQQSNDSTTSSSIDDSLDIMPDIVPPSIDFSQYGPSSSIPLAEPSFDRDSLRHIFTRPASVPFRIQDPLVVDINRVTQTGVVATGKHRRAVVRSDCHSKRSEHKILFWDYPSWRLIRELEINFVPPEIACQVVGLQTVRIKSPIISDDQDADQSYRSIRLFALAIGQPIDVHGGGGHLEFDDDLDENDDRVDLWQAVLIYRLFDNGAIQCLANVPLDGRFMGREIFFFSDFSWTFGDTDEGDGGNTTTTIPNDDGSTSNFKKRNVKDWLQMVAPEHTEYDPHFTLFMLAVGPTSPDTDGCGKLIQCDLREDPNILDPALTSVTWNPISRRIVPVRRGSMPSHHHQQRQQQYRETTTDSSIKASTNHLRQLPPPPAKIIHTVYLGSHISCMIHFRYPTCLNHLICTGSYDSNELSVYDWRFGVKVGTLPWEPEQRQQQQQQPEHQQRHGARNNRRAPLHHQHLRHNVERHPPPVPPPTRPDRVDENYLEPAELNDAVTILGQMMTRNQRDGIDQLTGQMIRQQQMNASDDDGEDNDVVIQPGIDEDDAEEDNDVAIQPGIDEDDDDDDDFEMDFRHEVRPWGLESTMVLPPYWDHRTPSNEELAHRGFRLIAVGDNRINRLEIKVWDISFLLLQDWDPLQRHDDDMNYDNEDDDDDDMIMAESKTADDWQKHVEWTKVFPWWRRGSQHLRSLGLRVVYERVQWDERHYATSYIPFEIRRLLKRDLKLQQQAKQVEWPLSPPKNHHTMLLTHAFDRSIWNTGGSPSTMTVKYTAYNVLCTSLFLLTEDGKVTVLDIETGKVTGTIDNVAATASGRTNPPLPFGRVRGIDVNVVSGHEVVVTSREGLLRSVIS
ncbi:unnamed protein product [Absidia cylindrospora]